MDSGSKSRCRKSTNWPTNGLESLPHEVALDILSRLPITSLTRCRFVSRSWQNLTSDHDLINLHVSRTAKNNNCLIFHRSFSFGNQLHFVEFSDHNYKEKVRKIQTPFPTPLPKAEFKVVGSCNGLICLSYSINHDVLQICNPFTRSYKNLPPPSMQFLDQRVLAGFGFHPLTNEYKVIRITCYQNVHDRYSHSVPVHSESEVQVYSMDSNNWRLIGKIPYQVERWPSELLLVNGRLHWLCRFGYGGEYCRKIISFDLADELFREVPTPEWGGIRSYHYPLAILGGCLCMLVYPHFRNLEIWVMKKYGVRESWSKNFEIDVNCPHPRGSRMWSTSLKSLACQVLCLMKNGGILLMHDGSLASYDPDRRELKNVMFKGMPSSFQVVLHEGSLVWI